MALYVVYSVDKVVLEKNASSVFRVEVIRVRSDR
jgi:hypothetical protein